jgi:tripartite-type tricarboxylate transporter receptor subunit TctC
MRHLPDDRGPTQRRQFLRAVAACSAPWSAFSSGGRCEAAGAPIRILCSGPAGSIPDFIARAIGDQLPATLGQRAVVDNRPGAAGQLSVNALKAAPADGSTLLLAQGAIATVYPFLYSRLSYDAGVDLQPVSLASEMPLALAVGPAVPPDVATLGDFLAWGRRHPTDLNVGSPGTGTLPHLLEAMLFREAGLAWQHVAYSGGPPAVNDLLGGRIAALALPEGLLRQHHATRRVRVLATSGSTRSAYLPEVPSFVEQGHATLLVKEWFAFFAAGRVSKDIVSRMSAALVGAIARSEVSIAFSQAGMTPTSSSPSDLAARIAVEQRHWQAVLGAIDVHVD